MIESTVFTRQSENSFVYRMVAIQVVDSRVTSGPIDRPTCMCGTGEILPHDMVAITIHDDPLYDRKT